jgi:uncharacterized protein (DUF1800 family)
MTDLLAPYEPSAADPFDLRKVGHLCRRAGFGASLARRRELARLPVAEAVGTLAPVAGEPSPADALLAEAIALGDRQRVRAFRVLRVLQADRPLRERMSWFWHGHFATSDQKVDDPRAMALQLATFDRLGLGRFDDLCLAMAQDPALLRWLDNDTNVRGRPNENFAREFFELFTLGRGNYGEADVRAAARAFAGHHVRDGRFYFAAHLADGDEKELFGQRGPFDGAQVVAMTVARPESARFLASRLLRCFVHPEPEPAEIEAVARCYEQHGRDVGAVLRVLLQSRLFFSPRAYRSKIKSPADYVLGLVRSLGARAVPADLAAAMGTMGELWLEPPSVEGWHGEREWLSPAAWLLRTNFAGELLAGRRGRLRPDPDVVLAGLERPEDRVKAVLLLLLDGDVGAAGREQLCAFAESPAATGPLGAAALMHAATALPEYQLL